MFDIREEVKKYHAWHDDLVNGVELVTKRLPKQPQQTHISKIIDYDEQAEREGQFISRRFNGCNPDFDIRLKRGQKHRPGGS